MPRLTALFFAGLCLALTVSCGASLKHFHARSVTEAELLREEISRKDFHDNNIAVADGKLAMARDGADMIAVYNADLAAALYREALAAHSLEESRRVLSDAATALAQSEEQVKKYETILAEITAERGK